MTLTKDSYISIAGCTAEGDLHVAGNEMTMDTAKEYPIKWIGHPEG